MSVCGHWGAREEQGADGASMKAPLSSRKPCSGSSTSLAMPLLAAAQIICKWQPRGSEEDAVEIDDTMAAAKVIDTLMFDLVMMVAAATVQQAAAKNKSFQDMFFAIPATAWPPS